MNTNNLIVVLQLVAQGLANNAFPNQTIEEYVVACLGRPLANQLIVEITAVNTQTLKDILNEINLS